MSVSPDSINVLHVDDEPGFAEMSASFLEREDDRFSVKTVTSPQDAEQYLVEDGFDCIVSDYDMPEENGIEFLNWVRTEYGDLPFILFTGKGSEEIASDAISAGVSDYLQKNGGDGQYTVLANRIKNIVTRYRAEQRVETYLETSPDGIVIVGADGEIRRVNEQIESLFGYERDELVGEPVEVLIPERVREAHVGFREQYVEAPERRPMGANLELSAQRRDGSEFPVDISLSPVYINTDLEVIASVRDATQRRQREETLAELTRINETLRETTQSVIRADTRGEIVQAACESLADSKPYVFAWIGTVTEEQEVVPEAWAGIEAGYLDTISITTVEHPTGQGPTGRAARTGEPQAMQNIHADPAYEPWREAAIERGYESSAAIPLMYDGTSYGLLNVYAERPGAFDERELTILGELGATIGHTIGCVEGTKTR